MWPFEKSVTPAETVLPGSPVPADAELEEVEAGYLAAEQTFDEATVAVLRYQRENPKLDAITVFNHVASVRVGAMLADPELSRLCSLRAEARQCRNSLLNRRADVLRRAGRIR
jgi:hypothetical protein